MAKQKVDKPQGELVDLVDRNDYKVEIIQDFKKDLKIGETYIVSGSVAEALILKGIAKLV